MDESSMEHVKGVIEALLFISEKTVTLPQIKNVLETVEVSDIRNIIKMLRKEYQENNRGMVIIEIAGGYQMMSNSIYAEYVRSFYKTKHKEKLSKPSLETLAIIAYKQPVTRSDVELIRGVNSDGVMAHLLNKELIKIVGRKDVPGRPYLYGSTKQFLEYFGLKSLEDLPKLEDFPKLEAKMEGDTTEDTQEVQAQEVKAQESEEQIEAQVEKQEEQPQSEQETSLEAAEAEFEKSIEEADEPNLEKAIEEVKREEVISNAVEKGEENESA